MASASVGSFPSSHSSSISAPACHYGVSKATPECQARRLAMPGQVWRSRARVLSNDSRVIASS